jgi:rubrerythrin
MSYDQTDSGSAFAAIGSLDCLDVEALKVLYRVENSGEDFYNQLADRVDNPQAAELLRRNGREEAGHARRALRAIGHKLGTDFEPTPQMSERFPVSVPDVLSPRLLARLVQGEFDGDAGYQRWADNEPDPEVARLLRLNGREETLHGERVKEVLAILESSTS